MKPLVLIIAMLATVWSVNAQKVKVTSDPAVDLTNYKTYQWAPHKGSSNPLIHQTIVNAVDRALAAKGLRKSDVDPQMTVTILAAIEFDMHTTYPSWSPAFNSINSGIVVGTQSWPVTKGTLMVGLLDAKSKNDVWRGTASDTLDHGPTGNVAKDARSVEKVINKAVDKMFKKYPRPSNK